MLWMYFGNFYDGNKSTGTASDMCSWCKGSHRFRLNCVPGVRKAIHAESHTIVSASHPFMFSSRERLSVSAISFDCHFIRLPLRSTATSFDRHFVRPPPLHPIATSSDQVE